MLVNYAIEPLYNTIVSYKSPQHTLHSSPSGPYRECHLWESSFDPYPIFVIVTMFVASCCVTDRVVSRFRDIFWNVFRKQMIMLLFGSTAWYYQFRKIQNSVTFAYVRDYRSNRPKTYLIRILVTFYNTIIHRGLTNIAHILQKTILNAFSSIISSDSYPSSAAYMWQWTDMRCGKCLYVSCKHTKQTQNMVHPKLGYHDGIYTE